uniref:Uncharacterized protein n=1 Tax=Rhizophora mucronata TaxID=61149 RepID=A0A2P2NYI2_RHIMU
MTHKLKVWVYYLMEITHKFNIYLDHVQISFCFRLSFPNRY